MAIVINGSGTVTGLAVGGLPDGTVDDGTVASGIASSKLTGALPAISGASLTGFTDAQMPTGSVLQVVQNIYSTPVTSGTTSYVATGLTGSITPSSTSSKILVTVQQYFTFRVTTSSERLAFFKLLRGSTDLKVYSYNLISQLGTADFRVPVISSYSYLDSPNTTSAITYSTQKKLNGQQADLLSQNDNSPSTITLMEIAG